MKPLIKYPGGKYKEYEKIKQFFPKEINNYYEPFFGGGGVFFRLKNENKIQERNDKNELLLNTNKELCASLVNAIEAKSIKINTDNFDETRDRKIFFMIVF